MQFHRPSITQHRLRRLVLWTLAVLTWIAAMLCGDRAITLRHIKQRGDLISPPWLTQCVRCLLIIRAAHLARISRPKRLVHWRRGRDLRRSQLFRSALGARLRRALRHKDFCTWIANLIHVLRNLDTFAALLGKRLRNGFTRLVRNWKPFALSVPLFGALAPSPAVSDSS